MTRQERCELAIKKGYHYNPITGEVLNIYNKPLKNKYSIGYYYFQLKGNDKYYHLKHHHFAWYYMTKEIVEQIDHKDRDRSNNKWNNLRSVTHHQNQFNKSDIKGYRYHKSTKKYQSYITLNRKFISLGYYHTIEEAQQAYLDAKEIYHKID